MTARLCRHHHGGAGPPIVVVAQALRPAERRLGLRRTTAATAVALLPPLRQPPAARRSHSATIPSPPPGCREFGRELEGWSLVGGLRARRLVPGGAATTLHLAATTRSKVGSVGRHSIAPARTREAPLNVSFVMGTCVLAIGRVVECAGPEKAVGAGRHEVRESR